MKKLLFVLFLLAVVGGQGLSLRAQEMYVGGDISLLQSYEDHGVDYYDLQNRRISDVVKYLGGVEVGWNAARVRLFVNPKGGDNDGNADVQVCQDLDYVVRFCKRLKAEGFAVLLDIQYTDSWADPSNQWIPAAWADLNETQLLARVYDYTKECLQRLVDEGAAPDFIQTGNEISYGMLWSADHTSSANRCLSNSPEANWTRFVNLLNQASRACREVCPQAKVMIHCERSGQPSILKLFYNKLAAVDYDVIGLSYYPFWHNSLDVLSQSLNMLATDFPDKKVQIVETGYYYQHQPGADAGTKYDFSSTWPITPAGQAAFIRDLVAELKKHANVNGLYYWFPEENGTGPEDGVLSYWLNRGLWDNTSHRAMAALTELKAFVGSGGDVIGDRTVPTYRGPVSDFRSNQVVYLLHKATNLFYSYGNDWGTHVSLSERGIPLSFNPTGETQGEEVYIYEISNYHPQKGQWYYAFLEYDKEADPSTLTYHLYTDGARTREDHYFCVEPTENKAFRIYGAETNATVKHSGDFEDYYVALDPNYVDTYHADEETGEGIATGTGIIYAAASEFDQNEWMVVLEEDYRTYEYQLRIYDRSQELLALIQEAEEMGISDLDDAYTAYHNLSLSYEQLSEAISALLQRFSEYYQENVTPENPIDMTRYIQNPGFEDGIDGWVNGGVGTFEHYDTVSKGWADVVDGTSFTGQCYLNLWNGDAFAGPMASQTITGLPNGVYEVTIAAFADAEGGYVFAGDVKTAVNSGKIGDTQYGQDYTMTTLVTDGTLQLGYYGETTGAFWAAMDNVRLLYFGAGEDAYAAWVQKSIEQAPSFDGARCQAALVATYKQALENLQKAALDATLMTYVQAFLDALAACNDNVAAYNLLEATINAANEEKYSYWEFDQNQVDDYLTKTATPTLEAVKSSTKEVEAVTLGLKDAMSKAQATLELFDQLVELNDYLKQCLDTYATTSAPDAYQKAAALSAELDKKLAEEAFENSEQMQTAMNQIEAAVHDLRLPAGEASDENPMDYTVYIVNPDFEDGTTGWENVNGDMDTFEAAGSWGDGVSAMSDHGSAYLNLWDSWPQAYRVEQTLTGLPNGTYTLSVTAYTNKAQTTVVFAGNDNVLVEAADALPGNAHRYEVTTKVTDGTLTIGVMVYNEGDVWCTFDDFTLTGYGPASVREVSGDAAAGILPVGITDIEDGPRTTDKDLTQPFSGLGGSVYNLAGQRLQKLQKGINIVNGKKLIVR